MLIKFVQSNSITRIKNLTTIILRLAGSTTQLISEGETKSKYSTFPWYAF